LETIKVLVECGADINSKTNDQSTPLHSAAKYGFLEIVQFLVQCGAVINSYDTNNKTPLQQAKMRGNTSVVNFLQWRHGNYQSSTSSGIYVVDCRSKHF
jgi:ankyrin repeat protein